MRVRLLSAFAATLLWAGPALAVPVNVYFSWGSGASQNTSYDSTQLNETDNGDRRAGASLGT